MRIPSFQTSFKQCLLQLLFYCYYWHSSVRGVHEKTAPPGTSSLTFVFDTTGSMNDDLIQVQDGAKKILDTVLTQREKLIYNYIYVPFHDPKVGPIFVTTDSTAFQRHLSSVHVVGGGDCPEMALSGIQLALEASLPSSFIYAFTDARAKDYHLEDQILNLIQEKQSSVVFVMTGDCNDRTHPGFQCYEKIAAASFGQVFHLEKTDVNKVLNYVRHSIAIKRVHILYEIRENGGSTLRQIPVDRLLNELTLSLSGDKDDGDYLDISLVDPTGHRVDPAKLSSESGSIDLHNIKLIRIRDPMPGIWRVRTTSRLRHTLRVLGHGAIDFKYGFTTKPIDKVELSHPRPIAHQSTYLMINVTGLIPPGTVKEISLVDYYGKELFSKPATMHLQNPHLYYVGPFIPPLSLFFVRVKGEDNQSYEFQRIAPTAISAVQASGPRAYMADRITALASTTVNLTCSVASKGEFTLYWYKGHERIGEPLFYPSSDTSVWTLSDITPQDRGEYQCIVISPSGNHSAATFLETKEPIPEIISIRNESVGRGSLAFLHCHTQNYEATIQWLKGNSVVGNTAKTHTFPNGTLMIYDVDMQDAGAYRCRVQTTGGRAEASMYLRVLEAPKVYVTPQQLYFTRGQTFNISCSVAGDYVPEPQWYFNGIRIIPDQHKYYITYKYDLIVQQPTEANAGVYECHASNAAGSHMGSAHAHIAIPPKVRVTRDREMISRGDRVVLECTILQGNPKPKITWFRGGREVLSSKYITMDQKKLTIQGVQDSDAGSYTCVAQNVAGRDLGVINLDVGSMPTIVPTADTVRVNIERSVTLQCRAIGHPLPTVHWRRNGMSIDQLADRVKILPDGSLLINNVQLEDQDRYTCTATNIFGHKEKTTVLLVTGLVSPVLGHVPPEEQLIEGEELRLSCVVVLGIPKPVLKWYKDGKLLHSSDYVTIESGGSSLLIRKGRPQDKGRYTCVAISPAGNASLNINVELTKKPFIEKNDILEYTASAGELIEIPCRATGKPQPKVVWSVDGKPLSSTGQEYEILADNTLRIHQTSNSHSGKYVCTASNLAGEAKIAADVTILSPPIIAPGQISYNLIQGNPVTLPCEVHGDPMPKITWYLNDEEFKDGFVDEEGSLTIESADELHRGQFKCVASNEAGKDEKVVTLTVHTAPTIEGSGQLKVIITNVNVSVLLPCPARAFPPPIRTWSYEGDRIYVGYSHGSEIKYTADGSLEIRTPQMNHAGRYTCHVSNLAGDDHITYLLKVQEPPRIISDIPGTIDVVIGFTIEIPCRAVGTPEPTIAWEKDGFQIIPDDIIHIDAAGTIRIEKAQLSHRGIFRCTATNPAGRDERNTLVLVQEPPTISSTTLSDYTTVEGDHIELRCFANANPLPKITWTRKGVPITNDTPRIRVIDDGTLIIDDVEIDDAGHYICKASNAAGDAEKVVRLSVITAPDIPDQDTVILETVAIGHPFTLYCPVFSNPLPQITWLLEERPIAETDANLVLSDDQRRLHVLKSRITDAGSYKCVARNPAGESAKTFLVEVVVPPNVDQSIHEMKLTALENEHIEIGCPISGMPEPDISWLVNGQLLDEGIVKRGVMLAPGGKTILIDSVQLEHEGIYTCVGTNKGGSLDVDVSLTVLAPPKLGEDELLEVIVGKSITLNCDVERAGFKSTISWLVNGSEMLPSNAQIVLDGRRMYLDELKLYNQGLYQCRVRNSAGQSTKNFDLHVLVPPRFRDKEYEADIQVTTGTTLPLTCYVEGTPQPDVQWFRDGQAVSGSQVSMSDQNQKFMVQYKDYASHRYTCIARNKVGSISREFFVQVIAPPEMIDIGDRKSIEVIEGHTLTLECPLSSPVETIDIEWFKNGRPVSSDDGNVQISLDKTRLVMVNIQKDAEATYACVARNLAGQASREFDITVIVPPSISGRVVEEILIVEGDSLELECDFEADPIPDIQWTKDAIDVGRTVQLLNEKRTALVPMVSGENAGSYRCIITNKAGQAEKTFNVRVIIKPELKDAGMTTIVETLIHRPITFECPLAISSDAELSWTKNDIPLIFGYDDNIQILNGGRQLVITAVQPHDQATYTCVARNKAGETSKNYKLLVLVPPIISGSGGQYKVIENNSLILPCEVEGQPYPFITWTKNGAPALQLSSVQALSEGQQLKIGQAAAEHRGTYTCSALNKVGRAEISFDVDVIIRPSIAKEVEKVIEVVRNDSTVIKCPVTDTRFSGEITWLKDYHPVRIDGHKYAQSQSGYKFHINQANLRDEGSYSCRVRNDAGESKVDYKLNVLLPPEILILDKDKNRTVIEDSTVTLSCPVTGKPEPTIAWFKDGELLTSQNITRKIRTGSIEGNDLKIAHVQVVNSGRFTCEARNKAGMVEQDIILYVMTPPKIEREGVPSEIGGKLKSSLTLNCPTYGRPMPTVTWLKAGRPFNYGPEIYFSANGMKLHFLNLDKEYVDRYTCIARNQAGEDKRDFIVKLLEAPTIEGPNILRRLQVNAGRTAIINCPAFGSPEPSISWLKNGQPLLFDHRYAILNGGRQLEISDTSVEDDARYTCIATNDIGSADLETYLQIVGSPVIAGAKHELVEVLVNEPEDLICDVSGTEPIDIEWLRDGKTIEFSRGLHSGSNYLQISSRGRVLHILSAQIANTARYTCVARNTAGETRKIYDLQVLVPPTINDSSSSQPLQTIIPGTGFAIECNVQAVPDAQIVWTKDNRLIGPDNGFVMLNNNQTIWINVAREGFDGRYTCMATNKAGRASRDFTIKLTAPPVLDRAIQEMDALVGDYVILTCNVISGTGKLAVKWVIDGREVKNGQISSTVLVDDRRIEIRSARLSDSGSYVCVVQNEAGEARKTFELAVLERPRFLDMTNMSPSIIVGRPLLLDCSVTGTPKPTVIWTKNGQPIIDTDVLFMNDRQQLHIESATEQDAGRYSCVAENKPGRAEKDLIVAVLKPPEMMDQYRVLELPENEALTLSCPINDPSVEIQWIKNGLPITTSSNLQLSASGLKLHILHGQLSDAGRYICRAWNDAGEATAYMEVIILVPPKITEPIFRTIDSILNQTVHIECRTTGIPIPNIAWSFDGRAIFPSEKIQILNNGTLLVLHEVQVSQEGRYSCTSTNKVGKAEADTFLQVTAPPRILTSVDELKVIQGQGQTIQCEVSGMPAPNVAWLKNGQRFDVPMTQTSSNLHYIHIREAQVSDAGRYTCIATNRAGEHRMTTQLFVLVPPMILEGERVVQVKENTALTLECIATGNPKPQIVWKRDGKPLDMYDSYLVIANSKASDAGRYTCEARNEAGKVSADFEVDIFIRPHFRDLKPDVRVRDGERARLECKVDGHPEPTITWMRGGRPIEDMRNIILSPRGETLMILKSRRADSGSYSCVAKNFAGEAEAGFTVTVLTAPHIDEQIDQNPRVVEGNDVILYCPMQGNPEPKITWLYNGEPVKLNRVTMFDKTSLLIRESQQRDSGRYTCNGENEAGILNMNYELEIIGPPKLHHRGEAVYEVIVGKTVTMNCDVEAEPRPEIYWFRGDLPVYLSENIQISPDGQQITIRGAEINDGGKYTCKAQNEAGSADIDLTLKVLVPPSIDTSNIIGNPLAIAGRSIYLECPVSGIPQPVVIWYKDNMQISPDDNRLVLEQNNQTFGIKEVQVNDQGRYLCVAENKGGRVEQIFNLEVLVPPELETTVSQKHTKREKDSVTLFCPIKRIQHSTAPTEILWYKDGRPIDAYGVPNIKISSEGQRLQIMRTSLADAGNYSCVAVNRAGELSLDFHVEILSLPRLDYSRNEQQPHVAVGRPITLWCMVSGHPFPTIRWLKDGHNVQIDDESGMRLIEGGQGLEILEAKREHGGVWVCEASNAAGKREYEMSLDIWTLPTVFIYPEENVKTVDSSIMMQCQASGNPLPSLSWSKDGQPLITSAEGARISLNGARLDIPRLKQSHIGEYTCTAVNEVGTSRATVHIDVLVPPVIMRDNVEMSLRLPTTQMLTLLCDVTGKPLPEISWYANNTVIDETKRNVVIGEGGRYLQISDISLSDQGEYKCIATNIAGRDELLYTVAIVQAPTILNGGTYQIIESEEAQIVCNVIGEPAPLITWHRNGILIENDLRYTVENEILRIKDVRSSDSGLYVCIATNEAGTAQQAFTLEVLVAPRIVTTSPNESVVPIGNPFSLKCGSRGYPPPEIIWSLNGQPIDNKKEGYFVAEDGTLFVERIQKQTRLIFKCTTKNSAGIDEKEYVVRTIAPPILTKKGIKNINTTEGEPSLLICEIEGEIPEIYWYKDGAPLVLKPNVELSADRTQIKIHHSKLHDEGLYSCIAVNPAGNATQKQQLYVGVPPRITEKPRRIIVKSGQPAELWCEAVGIPKPHITWLKDDKALPQTALDDHTEMLKSTALFANVSSRDAGVYTCKAENWAGISYKDVDLVVLIPPEIYPERLNISANVDETVMLTCNTTGIPEPVVSWVKMPNIDIVDNDERYQIHGTSLFIKNLTSDDDGFYHCVAKSNAGQAIGSRRLTVKMPKKEYRVIWVECDEFGQPIKTTFVPARGDVPEDGNDLLPWKQDKQDLPQNGTDGILIRCLPSAREPRHAQLALPKFVLSPKTQKVLPGTIVNLHCSAIGQPTPHIIWMRNGTFVTGASQSRDGYSVLQVKVDTDEDLGDYICLAQNAAGAAISTATLFSERNLNKNPTRSVAVLTCNTVRNENIVWKLLDSLLNSSNDRVNILPNNSLVVYDITENNSSDLLDYHCYMKNQKQPIITSFLEIPEEIPHVQISPKQIIAKVGEMALLNCTTKSNQLTTQIHWSKNDRKLKNGGRIKILGNNSLQIMNLLLTDRAIFKCIASNYRGKSYDAAELIIRDGPFGVVNAFEGIVNGRKIKRETVISNIKSEIDGNSVTMNLKDIFGKKQDAKTEALLGFMILVCPQLVFNPFQENQNSLAYMKFDRIVDYHFASGEMIRVSEKGQSLDGEYVFFKILFNGQIPHFDHENYLWMDEAKENLVENKPGFVSGHGMGALHIGSEIFIQFWWNETITYDASKGMIIGSGRSLAVKFIPRLLADDKAKLNVLSRSVSVQGICPDGYQMKDGFCSDVNECESALQVCHENARCINTIGGYICERNCPSGYKAGLQGDCEDIDECILGLHNCTSGVKCKNTLGGFFCEISICASGYARDPNGYCKDIDECEETICGHLKCINYFGSYRCICPNGFPLNDNGHCEDFSMNSTDIKTISFENANFCAKGYYRDEGLCRDINECAFDSPCKFQCQNTVGSFECLCPEGYETENNDCIDIDECLYNPCSENELCFNQLGKYVCLSNPCPVGYLLQEQKCVSKCSNCSNSSIRISLISLPRGIPPQKSLLRVTAFDRYSRVLRQTRFFVKNLSQYSKHTPFILKIKDGRAVLQNTEGLYKPETFQLAIRSISKLPYSNDKFRSDFIVFIDVSEYDF